MTRRFYTFLLSTILVLTVHAQKPTAIINKASVAPVIDGVIDSVWAEADPPNIIDKAYQSDTPTLGASGETSWQALWTDLGIYVLVQVNDDYFYPGYIAQDYNWFLFDNVQLFFDVNNELLDGAGPIINGLGHYLTPLIFSALTIDGTPTTNEAIGFDYASLVKDPSYIAEFFIPFSTLVDKDGNPLEKSNPIGFDVTIVDRDPGDEFRNSAVWANIGNSGESWDNMDDCGIIYLEGAGSNIPIDSISLSGGTITEDNGTLQIVAEIFPIDASTQTLIWSVKDAGGKAAISSTGLLTGLVNGDVNVYAKSTDGSNKKASVKVTISGQLATKLDFSIIKNGSFDMVESDGTASYWDGWTDASPPYKIVGGVAVCSPIMTPNVWQYQFWQQSLLNGLPNLDYTLSFIAWADAKRTFNVTFEDSPENNYNRYGSSSDPESLDGRSEWTFDITNEPTEYTLHVNFDELLGNTVQKLVFQLGLSDEIVYLDDICLISVNDSPLADFFDSNLSREIHVVCGDSLRLDPGINYSGDGELTYVWTPSEGLSDASIANPIAFIKTDTYYELKVTSTDFGEINDSVMIFVDPVTVNCGTDTTLICGGSIKLSKPLSNLSDDGTLEYSWLPVAGLNSANVAQPTVEIISDAEYTLEVITSNGCKAVDDIIVKVNPLTANIDELNISCGNQPQLNLTTNYTGSGVLAYSWTPTTGLSSSTIPNPGVDAIANTNYSVSVSTPNGCIAEDDVLVNVSVTSEIPSICLVSVDENDNNVIVIKKDPSNGIGSYFVYRESSFQTDQFDLIGVVPYSENATFTDLQSNARVQSNKYCIAIKDRCGFVTNKSSFHKTVHLSINKGMGNDWNLSWDPYIGVPISSYKILRGTSKSDLVEIANTSGSNTSFTDVDVPKGDVYYQIEGILTNSCTSLKSTSYASVRSNISSSTAVSIERFNGADYPDFIYPNPANNILSVRSGFSKDAILIIYDSLGKVVMTSKALDQIDISELYKGIYFVKLVKPDKTLVNKLVKQ